jgi:predicted membrane protein
MEKLDNTKPEARKTRTGLFGLILILAGLVIIGDQFDMFSLRARDILFTWQTLLIIIGVIFLSKQDGKLTGTILIIIGVFFILPKFAVVPYNYLKLFWPTLLIFLGLFILIRGVFGKGHGISSSKMDGDAIEDVNIFGAHDRIITNENFKGGEIVNIFGGGKYNLLQSKLAPGNNILEVVMVFGGSKIIVPQDWEVKVEVAAVFGGFSDKRIVPDGGIKSPDRSLIIKGVAIFGGGEIASFDN